MKLNYIILLIIVTFKTNCYTQQFYQNNILYNKLIKSEKINITSNSNIVLDNRIYQKDNEIKTLSSNFAANKKKLPWPIKNGIIISKFGKQPHPILPNIITHNTGIEFATYKGTNACAVFSGKIFKIQSIPGNNKVIIIKHGDYFTIYTNLDDIFVKVGEKVHAKQEIGRIYTDDDGNTFLKFQIWKGINKINPSDWLINL